MYQQQKINPTKMSPDTEKHIGEMVNTVSQQVTSRSSLEGIITKFDLYPGLRKSVPMEDVVDYMRKHKIMIRFQKGDIFTVSFEGNSPRQVMNITNELAAKFIEENLRFREAVVSETSAYVKDELNMAKESLDKKEAIMRDYKLKYYNEMPEQLAVNMTRVNALHEQYQNSQINIQNLENTRLLIQEQISMRKDMLVKNISGGLLAKKDDTSSKGMEGYSSLDEAKAALKQLQLRYTDEHPDIKRLKKIIEKMEHSSDQASSGTSKNGEVAGGLTDSQLEKLQVQLKEVELNIDNLKDERRKIQKQIDQYQEWVDATPIREAEWSALTRDYNELKKHYEDLVAQNLQAASAETLERRQKGSQFKIVDPAHLPETPFKPDFKKIMLLAALLGLGLGGAISFGFEFLDTSFKSPEDLEAYTGLPVTIAIPLISTGTEKKNKRIISLAWTLVFIGVFIMIGTGISYLLAKGLIII